MHRFPETMVYCKIYTSKIAVISPNFTKFHLHPVLFKPGFAPDPCAKRHATSLVVPTQRREEFTMYDHTGEMRDLDSGHR